MLTIEVRSIEFIQAIPKLIQMIKYSLICKDCDLAFESWFSNSKDYEKLKKKNVLNCQKCNSTNIKKS